jgi:hypothetical protein
MNLSRYNKFWVALGTASGVLVLSCAPDAETKQAAFVLTRTELYQALLAFTGAFGVFQIANKK